MSHPHTCEDPHCSCHDHHGQEEHHHHHHHHGEEVVDSALILSRSGRMAGGEMSREEAVQRGSRALLALAEAVAVEGVVLGHIKALLSCGGVDCTLSVTRTGTCDVLLSEEREVRGLWTATVNLISMVPAREDLEPLLRNLIADD